MMREPRVQTAKRTMVLMATSLALTAGGILLAYLLVHATPEEGKTMNAVLFERVAGAWQLGGVRSGTGSSIMALVSEGALLFVAAQAGFVDGPRVMANMATDSWLPHRFAALSERLSMRNGVLLMAWPSFAALVYTQGDVGRLVVMYSINVFLTFSLSNLGMSRYWIKHREEHPGLVAAPARAPHGARPLPDDSGGHVLEKFTEGGWITLVITGMLVGSASSSSVTTGSSCAIRRLDQEFPAPDDIPGAVRRDAAPQREPRRRIRSRCSSSVATAVSGATRSRALAHVPRPLQRGRVRQRGGGRLRRLQRRRPGPSAGEADQREPRPRTNVRRASASRPSAYAVGTEVAVEAERLGTSSSGNTRRRSWSPASSSSEGQLLEPHPPQRDRVPHPAALAAPACR